MGDVVDLDRERLKARITQLAEEAAQRAAAAMANHRGQDGKVDLVGALSELSGVPSEEVAWSLRRTHELLRAGMSREDLRVALREEARGKPWLR